MYAIRSYYAMNPTFFTNWIGSNDVLSYATNGGAQSDGMTPAADHNETGNTDPSTYGGNDITNAMVFGSVYSSIVNTLISGGAKGVVATIPSVTSIPYFTTVPYAPLSRITSYNVCYTKLLRHQYSLHHQQISLIH